jgi:hypothetical protein
VQIVFKGWTGALTNAQLRSSVATTSPSTVHATFATDYADIRTFTIASLFVSAMAAFILVVRRGYTPKVRQQG